MARHKHADLICAWAEGAEIQWKKTNGEWIGVGNDPVWMETDEYRVKPQPKPESDKAGGPAFPSNTVLPNGNGTENTTYYFGMTLLDYFAGQAMLFYASQDYVGYEEAAERSYDRAEAMLKEREKRK